VRTVNGKLLVGTSARFLVIGLVVALALSAAILWRRRRLRSSVAVLAGGLIGVVVAVVVIAFAS